MHTLVIRVPVWFSCASQHQQLKSCRATLTKSKELAFRFTYSPPPLPHPFTKAILYALCLQSIKRAQYISVLLFHQPRARESSVTSGNTHPDTRFERVPSRFLEPAWVELATHG
ncbi:unnamed protein product [Ectocarpus sp. 13 AM-2016]